MNSLALPFSNEPENMSTIDTPVPVLLDGDFPESSSKPSDAVLHLCAEWGLITHVSSSVILMAKQIKGKVSLPCGHITSI